MVALANAYLVVICACRLFFIEKNIHFPIGCLMVSVYKALTFYAPFAFTVWWTRERLSTVTH